MTQLHDASHQRLRYCPRPRPKRALLSSDASLAMCLDSHSFVLTCCSGVSKEKCLFNDSSSSSVTPAPSPGPAAILLDDLGSLLLSIGARADRRATELPCSIAANLDPSPPSHPAPRPPPPSPPPPPTSILIPPPSGGGVALMIFWPYP